MMGAARRRQLDRESICRSCEAHLVGSTARNGWARFTSVSDARIAVELMCQDDDNVVTVVYSQGEQIALDWSDEPRYANGNVVR